MGRAARIRQAAREQESLDQVPLALPGVVLLEGERLPWQAVVAQLVSYRADEDRMEREAVKAARMGGATWEQIAAGFEGTISRVQLARRYREL